MFCGHINNVNFKHIKYIEDLSIKNVYKIIQIKKNLFVVNYNKCIKILSKAPNILDVEYSFLELIDRNDILKLKLGEVNFIERNVKVFRFKVKN